MKRFTLFGSRLLFWMLAPWVVASIPVFAFLAYHGFLLKEWVGSAIMSVLLLFCIFGVLMALSPKRFGWLGLIIGGSIGVAFILYFCNTFLLAIHHLSVKPFNVILGIIVFVLFGIALMYFMYFVHCTLNRICVRHAKRFCGRNGLVVQRVRWQMEFELRSDGRRGVKTEFTLVQLDCFDSQKQHRLVLLRVWLFGVRKMLSDKKYPESYDEQWPQNAPNMRIGCTAGSKK